MNNTPFSFKTRFQSEDGSAGTNPEELLAAAHAGCFTMATGATMGQQGFTPTNLETKAVLTMDMDTLTITAVDLTLTGSVPASIRLNLKKSPMMPRRTASSHAPSRPTSN